MKNIINLNSFGTSDTFFHTLTTKTNKGTTSDNSGKIQEIEYKSPYIITGYHQGEMNVGDEIVYRLNKFHKSLKIVSVIERRNHKGSFPLKGENGEIIMEAYKKPIFEKSGNIVSYIESEKPVNDTSKSKDSFFKIEVMEYEN